MVDGPDVPDAAGHPHPLRSWMRIDDAGHDGLGHSPILSVDDREKRGFDP
jgi:hypothetical protein